MICNLFKKHPKSPLETHPDILDDVIVTPEEREEFKDLLTNEAGIQLIKLSEGFHKKTRDGLAAPYLCPAGIPTIGYGAIEHPMRGLKVTMDDEPISKELAIHYLKWEVDEKENVIESYLATIGLNHNENQFSALVSFAYNLGTGIITQSRYTMNQVLKRGNKYEIANAFLLYNKARTTKWGIKKLRVLPGLVTRRKAERKLFLKGV